MKKHNYKGVSFILALCLTFSNILPVYADKDKKNDNKSSQISSDENLKAKKENIEQYLKKDPSQKIRVVVELEEDSIVDKANDKNLRVKDLSENQISSMEKDIEEGQSKLKEKIKKEKIQTFDTNDNNKADESFTTVINGFSTYIKASDYEKLKEMKEVKDIHISTEYQRPKDIVKMSSSNNMIGSPIAWDLGFKGEGLIVSVIDSGYDIEHKDFKITDSSKIALNKEKVEELIREYNLPGRYYSEKFPYAYNYYDLTHTIKSSVSNHGQHVAGTIAANGDVENGGIRGVAPEAQLLGMKVFSDDPIYSTTFDDIYTKAIDDSIKLGASAINMSLGSTAGDYVYGSLVEKAIKRANDNGVLVAIAAGNEHTVNTGIENFYDLLAHNIPFPYAKNNDTGLLGSPSLYKESLSVASINNEKILVNMLGYEINGEEKNTQTNYASEAPLPWDVGLSEVSGKDIVYINKENMGEGASNPGDAKSVENHPEVKDKVVLLERGNTFTDSIVNLQEAGAKALVVYNNEREDRDSLISMAGGELAKIPFTIIGRTAGLEIIDNLDKINLKFHKDKKQTENPKGYQLSDFSSWGSNKELQIKPEITAPGGDIYSTDNDDSYVNMSGTSMATPHVAGATALLYQRLYKDEDVFGKLDKSEIATIAKIILMNTAIPFDNPSGNPYLVREQGAGLMNLQQALKTKVYAYDTKSKEAKSEIGSFKDEKIELSYTLVNKSDKAKKFKIDAIALTDYVENADGIDYTVEESKVIDGYKVKSKENILVKAKSEVEVKVTIDLKDPIEKEILKENNFVEGFVYFKSLDGNEDISLPYLGFYGDFESMHVLDEPIYNLNDKDKSNDPMFTTTYLAKVRDGRALYKTPTNKPSYINNNAGDKEGYGFVSTVLRNYDHIDFSIEDKDGKIIKNIGRNSGGRKIFSMDQGDSPVRYFAESFWDGKVNSKVLDQGKSLYYTIKAYYKKNSKPQVIRFEVKLDNDAPILSAKNPNSIDKKVEFDKDNRLLKFNVSDKTSGLNAITLVRLDSIDSGDYVMQIVEGEDELKKYRKSGDKFDGYYELPLNEEMNSDFEIIVEDKAVNEDFDTVEINNDTKEKSLEKPEALNPYEDTKVLKVKVDKGSYLKAEDSDNNLLGEASDEDLDGLIDIKLIRSLVKDEKINLYSSLDDLSADSNFIVKQKDEILAPFVENIYKENLSGESLDVKGYLYQKGQSLVVKYKDEIIYEKNLKDDVEFSFKLDKKYFDKLSDIKVYAKENDKLSEGVSLEIKTFMAPRIDNDAIFEDDKKVSGDSFRPNSDVIFEKDGKELLKVKANNLGKFETSDLKVKNKDKLSIYSIKDNIESERLNLVVGEDDKIEGFGDLKIYLETPDLLLGYNSNKVRFKGVVYGWENVDEISFNGKKLNFTINEHQKVINPKDGKEVYYGKAYNFDEEIELKDGYYYYPLMVKDNKNNREMGINRRFWVDTKKPELSLDTIEDDQVLSYENIDGIKTIKIKTNSDSLSLKLSYKDDNPLAILLKDGVALEEKDISGYTGYGQYKVKGSVNDIIKFQEDSLEAKALYELEDIAGNVDQIQVIAVRDKKDPVLDGENPTIEAYDKFIFVDENIDLKDKVKAYDKDGNDISEKIEVEPEKIDTSKKGVVDVKYSVTDDDGNYSEKIIKINILDKSNESVDFSQLIDTLTKAKKIDGKYYSKKSFEEVEKLIKESEYLIKIGADGTNQEKIDTTNKDLEDAINNLVEISKLQNLLEFAKDIVENEKDLYSTNSLNDLIDAINQADEVLSYENSTKDQVLRAYENLNKKIKALENKEETKVDKEKLIALYDKYNDQINNGDIDKYTDESKEKLVEQLKLAKEIIEDENVSQDDVDKAYNNLIKAYSLLEEKSVEESVDKSILEEIYNLLKDKNLDEFNKESKDEFNKALENAKNLLDNENASQDEIYQAIDKLLLANDNLYENKKEEENLDKKEAELIIKFAQKLLEKDFEEKSKENLKEEIAKAKDLLEKAKEQKEVDKIVEDLEKAIDKLQVKEKEIDKSILENLLNIGKNLEQYAKDSQNLYDKLNKLLEDSDKLLKDIKVSQEDINEKAKELQKIIDEIKVQNKNNDLEKLKALIENTENALANIKISEDGKDLNKKDYYVRKQTYDKLKAILDENKKLLKNLEFSKEKYDQLEKELANFNKEKKQVEEIEKNGGKNNPNGNSNSNNPSNNDISKNTPSNDSKSKNRNNNSNIDNKNSNKKNLNSEGNRQINSIQKSNNNNNISRTKGGTSVKTGVKSSLPLILTTVSSILLYAGLKKKK